MSRRRGTAVAIALLGAALAAAGCGLGPGADVGDVQLTVTREFGAVPVLDRSLAAKESDTVMRLLEGEADVETRYGGGYVHAIDGVAEEQREGDPYDWFFYVDGAESPIGAAEYELDGGERVWWDYRDWSATNHVPAVVGSWPAPFVGAEEHPVVVECAEPSRGSFVGNNRTKEPQVCAETRRALEREGVVVASGEPEKAIRVLVGTWDRLRSDPTARLIENGPGESGVYADFSGFELVGLDGNGEPAERFSPDVGLVAATSRYGGLPVWVVTGATAAAVRGAAEALDAEHLRDHYAVAIENGKSTPLPLGER
ncbi:MAG TPA: DUF4430 domain-containing protein [Solirubrobacterales bacterium]|nr:DUF4430 domain-containing protein [Solirubrobacterales bacterium]